MVDRLQAVDFVARGKEGSESECLSLLHDVMKEWTDVVEKHSPGTEYEMAYLSRKHLTEHKDRPAVYSQEEVDKATSKGPFAFVTYNIELSEQLSDLLVFPPEQPVYTNTPNAEILTHLQDVEPDVLPVLSSKDEVSLSPAFDLSSSLQRSASLHPVLTSRWTSHGRPLETPDCMFGSEREIEYSVFGKRVECNKWVIAIHITNGSMGVYEALASKRRNHRYIELKLPGRDYIKSDGKIWLHIMCKKPWQLCQGKRSVSLNTKTIWRSDTHSSCYHEFEVEDCQRSARTLRCTIATFFEDKDKNISPSVQLVISKPVVETCQPSSKRAAREESADTLEGTIGDSSQPLHKGDQCVTFEHIAVVARCCSDKWRAFGRVLLHCGNTEVLNAVSGLSSTDTDYERLYCIIEKWKKKGEEATVGQLVEASGHFSVNCQGDVKQELKKAGLL